MTRETIAIVGPGRMGIGIATAVLMADRGHTVTLVDTKRREIGKESESLDRAREEVEANLALLDKLGGIRGNVKGLTGDLSFTRLLEEGIAGCSLVFEALPETVTIKQEFYQTIGPLMDKETVIDIVTTAFEDAEELSKILR